MNPRTSCILYEYKGAVAWFFSSFGETMERRQSQQSSTLFKCCEGKDFVIALNYMCLGIHMQYVHTNYDSDGDDYPCPAHPQGRYYRGDEDHHSAQVMHNESKCCLDLNALLVKSKVIVFEEGKGVAMSRNGEEYTQCRTAIVCVVCNRAWCFLRGTPKISMSINHKTLTLVSKCQCGTSAVVNNLALSTEIKQHDDDKVFADW